MWKTETPQPLLGCSVIERGQVRISVGEASNSPQRWQYFCMNFGLHTDKLHDACLETWPREALRLAREELDRFEATLNEEEG